MVVCERERKYKEERDRSCKKKILLEREKDLIEER